MTDHKDIAARLTNWGEWANGSAGSRGHDCMTGAICESLRKAHEGELHGGDTSQRGIDTADAVLIGRGMTKLSFQHRRLLGWHYIERARSPYIAKLLHFPHREYEARLLEAQQAIELIVANLHMCSSGH